MNSGGPANATTTASDPSLSSIAKLYPDVAFCRRAEQTGVAPAPPHDDKAREFDDTAGADKSLELARANGWTVVSMKNDWNTMFATLPTAR
jgi:hypothetical protein